MFRTTFLSLVICIISVPVIGQSISGTVTDEKGNPLGDVHVRITDSGITTITGNDGSFSLLIESLRKNEIILTVSRVGYRPVRMTLSRQEIGDGGIIEIQMKPTIYESETMVVTATRTLRDVEDVSIPVSVVSGEEINRSGSMRLSDILSEQTGMQIVNDHGTGIQMQGFDPDYTLIMIDGNPVIGRTTGTLDLTRISVRDVQQIEIVKGPSSALWGSDALAGVINIITKKSSEPVSGGLTTRYGENNTLDLNGSLSLNRAGWNNDVSINRNSSGGYSLNPESVSQTVPKFENYTLRYNTSYSFSDRLEFKAGIRYFHESQQSRSSIENEDEAIQLLRGDANRQDFIATPSVSFTPLSRLNLELEWMSSFYETESELRFSESGEMYDETQFSQYYNKPELQAGYRWNNTHHSMLGTGAIFERLDADRYPSQPKFTTQFMFAQHSYTPVQELELTGGLRFDSHSEYSSQWSPKLSARYKATDWIQFRASAGRGFKAPEFRQLFLDFTNSTAGYSVFGQSTAVEGIRRLQDEGNIAQILVPVENLDQIRAESSWAVNAGFDIDPTSNVRIRVNLFQNNVSDLIEAAPIARKTNGQSVFTYFNVDEVFTRGLESEVRVRITDQIWGSLGYQLLDARRKIVEDRTVQDDQGEIVERTDISYEPMFNRSRHSGNVKLFYESGNGWGANVRGSLRGRYGLFDSNGNEFVDDGECVPGHTVWNAAVFKELFGNLTIQAGADNLFNYRDINQPYLAGRLWYGQVTMNF
ncbi:TonB-dependent receptor [Rhodohalobacter sp. 8-1]|uniref:TonB-dependent receptor n=1 Tax=Rhodohalobacter sp. 8-1 TaxID=3131972 RepID=UPI0030EDDF43